MAPKKRRTSRYANYSKEATFTFEIDGYSRNKPLFNRSAVFAIGGYDWAIRFYPDGATATQGSFISTYLELLTKNCKVQVSHDLRLVNHATRLRRSVCKQSPPRMFGNPRCPQPQQHRNLLMARAYLEQEESGYIKDDCLKIECLLTVVHEPMVSNAMARSEIKVLSSHLSDHFGKLLEKGEGSDVTFIVAGVEIAAHKIVLAMRSPIFKAELYGKMMEKGARSVTMEDTQPDVFRALLHFIYTDSLPDMDDVDDRDYIN